MEERDLAIFCNQLGLILKSGITLHEGVAMMEEDVESPAIKVIFKKLAEALEEGKTMDNALEESGEFPNYMINMIKIGNLSGRLEDVMHALGLYYEREVRVKQSIKSAVCYPLILSGMMLIVMFILSIKVLPIFEEVFKNLGGELSGVARGFMHMGSAMGRYIYVVLALVIMLALGGIILVKTKKGTLALNKVTSKLKISEKIATARLASAMSLMIASGLDTEDALRTALQVVENEIVKTKVQACISQMEKGESFISALNKNNVFSKLSTRMLNIGMKTGALDEVIRQVADSYEEEIQEVLAKRVAIIEPTLVAVLAILVGIILLSVMLPLMGIMSSIG